PGAFAPGRRPYGPRSRCLPGDRSLLRHKPDQRPLAEMSQAARAPVRYGERHRTTGEPGTMSVKLADAGNGLAGVFYRTAGARSRTPPDGTRPHFEPRDRAPSLRAGKATTDHTNRY